MTKLNDHNNELFVLHTQKNRLWVENYLLDALESAGEQFHMEKAFSLGVVVYV